MLSWYGISSDRPVRDNLLRGKVAVCGEMFSCLLVYLHSFLQDSQSFRFNNAMVLHQVFSHTFASSEGPLTKRTLEIQQSLAATGENGLDRHDRLTRFGFIRSFRGCLNGIVLTPGEAEHFDIAGWDYFGMSSNYGAWIRATERCHIPHGRTGTRRRCPSQLKLTWRFWLGKPQSRHNQFDGKAFPLLRLMDNCISNSEDRPQLRVVEQLLKHLRFLTHFPNRRS